MYPDTGLFKDDVGRELEALEADFNAKFVIHATQA
jgi:hypothetical protein